jgi:formate hydrogenlyase subunit 4
MTYVLLVVCHVAVLLIAPIYVVGIINRVKAYWAGRRGPKLYQSFFDMLRLMRKTPVYSEVTSWIFPVSSTVVLATAVTSSLVSPIFPGFAPFGFPGDFLAFAYLLGLGKLFMMLSALDTGSPFEGMGASREATYSALAEPVLLLGLGTLAWSSGSTTFQDLVIPEASFGMNVGLRSAIAAGLYIVLLIEAARIPTDDPTTHLELTMVHEVMILDHSGPELGFMQQASALKMTVLMGVIAAILNPFNAEGSVAQLCLAVVTSVALIGLLAGSVGLVESLIARFRFRSLPLFTLAGFVVVMFVLVLYNVGQGHN